MKATGAMSKRIAVLCLSAVFYATPAFAGFEFVPASRQAAQPQYQGQQYRPVLSAEPPQAMPVLPAQPVSREPLPVEAPNAGDRILSRRVGQPQGAFVSHSAQPSPTTQSFDSDAVLDAAILGEALPIARHAAMEPQEYIAIEPYPLLSPEAGASHQTQALVASDQMVFENAGLLKPVKVPGSDRMAAIRRAAPQKETQIHLNDGTTIDAQIEEIILSPPPRKPSVPQMGESLRPVNAAYTEAVGFGRELPLALALSQIVPAGYTYSFGQAVDAGSTVSWQGGKPWNEVLNDMLASSGMRAVISGNQVRIENKSA